MPDFLGFSFMVILYLKGITFHPEVVLGPEHDFLFQSTSIYCAAIGFSSIDVQKKATSYVHNMYCAKIEMNSWNYS